MDAIRTRCGLTTRLSERAVPADVRRLDGAIERGVHAMRDRRPRWRSVWVWAVVRVLVAATFLAGAGLAESPAGPPAPGASWTVVGIGDSFMAGVGVDRRTRALPFVYGELLGEDLDAPIEVRNHGTGRITTVADWAVKLTDSSPHLAADLGRADIVLVWLGYHDVLVALGSGAAWPDPLRAQLEAVVEGSPASWDAFFSALVAAVPAHARILVGDLAIPPFLLDRFAGHPDWAEIRRLAYLDWRLVMVETADRYGARVVPTFAAVNGPDGDAVVAPGTWWPDGLHFDDVFHRFVAEVFREHDGIGRSD
jgi:putative intracellular protease/amidase